MTAGIVPWLLLAGGLFGTAACVQKPRAEETTTVPSTRVSAQGRVEGRTEPVEVSASLSGRVLRVTVDEGDAVAAGAVLAELDCEPLRAEAAQRRAELDVARANETRLHRGSRIEEREEAMARVRAAAVTAERAAADRKRAEQLKVDRVISGAELDRAQEAAAVAEAELAAARQRAAAVAAEPLPEEAARAKAQVSAAVRSVQETEARIAQCSVRAPIAGVVLRRHVEPGERIDAFSKAPIVTIGDVDGYRARIEVDERDVGRIALGQSLTIRAEALGEREVRGKVVRIGRLMGRKKVFSGEPQDKYDRDVLEVIAELQPQAQEKLPVGLRVTAYFDVSQR